MKMGILWPGDKGKISKEGISDPLQVYLDYAKYFNTDARLAIAFKKSADLIILQIETGQILELTDIYFFPISYLYRHAIELFLKQFIQYGIELNILKEDKKLLSIMAYHKLTPLWNKTRIVLDEVCAEENKKNFKKVECLIREFHEIDETGQNFRYSKDKNGKSTAEKLPEYVNLRILKNNCEGLFRFLDGCDSDLCAAIDAQNNVIK